MSLLERFDEQERRAVTDEDGLVVGDDWSAVLWLPPDVERTVERLRALPGHREWKLYGHDPAWLPDRLRELGLVPEDEETLVVAEASSLPAPPPDVELQVEVGPMATWVYAVVEGERVSRGRVHLLPNTEFAGFYGGETEPAFRGRGLYRATVLERARIARERGYRWVFVDALPTSRPILERLGFSRLTTTTPYVFPG